MGFSDDDPVRSSPNRHAFAGGSSHPRPIMADVAGSGATTDDDALVHLIRTAAGQMQIVIIGPLTTHGALALQATMLEALQARPHRIHLDLTGLTDCTPVGVAALATCLSLAQQLEGGVGVSVAGAAARRALLRCLNDR